MKLAGADGGVAPQAGIGCGGAWRWFDLGGLALAVRAGRADAAGPRGVRADTGGADTGGADVGGAAGCRGGGRGDGGGWDGGGWDAAGGDHGDETVEGLDEAIERFEVAAQGGGEPSEDRVSGAETGDDAADAGEEGAQVSRDIGEAGRNGGRGGGVVHTMFYTIGRGS